MGITEFVVMWSFALGCFVVLGSVKPAMTKKKCTYVRRIKVEFAVIEIKKASGAVNGAVEKVEEPQPGWCRACNLLTWCIFGSKRDDVRATMSYGGVRTQYVASSIAVLFCYPLRGSLWLAFSSTTSVYSWLSSCHLRPWCSPNANCSTIDMRVDGQSFENVRLRPHLPVLLQDGRKWCALTQDTYVSVGTTLGAVQKQPQTGEFVP